MKRSVEEVLERVEAERRELDSEISRQSVYCTRRQELVTPAQCHDCFLAIPYSERLIRWNENRMECVAEHGKAHPGDAGFKRETSKSRKLKQPRPRAEERFSIEAYLSRGMLGFLLELDTLSERFEGWQAKLTDSARERFHASLETQEMVLWLAAKLAEFRSLLLSIGKINQEDIKEE
ncbi:hypothetical protein GF359_10345 [candidate division WOR-3 bacterium]|uniref:Uncharacterized protein n=1 Tax=candidate division WOR-3 bacterium TaxID=2052148 RepID=A0A9D5KBC3_UNCW3|nr:hypothetical protein [candidate division WOR-3 bacterium]MBD3365600.1 hypothetical protein [candidate division WOR-3 bacterium]